FPFEGVPQRVPVAGPLRQKVCLVRIADNRRLILFSKRVYDLQREVPIDVQILESAVAAGIEDEQNIRRSVHDGIDHLAFAVFGEYEIRFLKVRWKLAQIAADADGQQDFLDTQSNRLSVVVMLRSLWLAAQPAALGFNVNRRGRHQKQNRRCLNPRLE